jgi:PhnB protein
MMMNRFFNTLRSQLGQPRGTLSGCFMEYAQTGSEQLVRCQGQPPGKTINFGIASTRSPVRCPEGTEGTGGTEHPILYAGHMNAPQIYVGFPGTAREALGFYAGVFGGLLSLYTYEEFGRNDGPPDSIAHGVLDGLVSLAGSDVADGEKSVRFEGLMLSLLGTTEPAILHEWFEKLAVNGQVVDPLAPKPWGASDGQVIDRYGLHWLIGYEPEP